MTRGGVTEYKPYIPAGAGSMAIHTRRTNGTSTNYYVTRDQLGSATAVMATAGNLMVNLSFAALGSRRGSAWQDVPSNDDWNQITATTRRGFTGHEHLDNLSLVHMNGRVYDPKLGRFISADPVYVGNLATPQSLNPYSYVMNNPLTFTDPSGFAVELCGDNRDCIDVIWRRPLSDVTGADRRQFADAFGLFGRYAGWYEGMAIDNSLGTVLAAADRIGNAAGQLGAILRSTLMPGAGSAAQSVTLPSGSTPPLDSVDEQPTSNGQKSSGNSELVGSSNTVQVDLPARGWGPFRPPGHEIFIGRSGTIIPPGGFISLVFEDTVFAGHTFGVNHDRLVGWLTITAGLPDAIVNIPTMPVVYWYSSIQEQTNLAVYGINEYLGTDFSIPYQHTDPRP